MKLSLKTLFLSLCVLAAPAFALPSTPSPASPQRAGMIASYGSSLAPLTQEVARLKIEVERIRTRQLQLRAANDEAGAKALDLSIRQNQNSLTLGQQEMQMYQEGISDLRTAQSDNQSIGAVQDSLIPLNMEKARIALKQAAANQAGRIAEAQQLNHEIKRTGLPVAAKQQEIELLTLQSK